MLACCFSFEQLAAIAVPLRRAKGKGTGEGNLFKKEYSRFISKRWIVPPYRFSAAVLL